MEDFLKDFINYAIFEITVICFIIGLLVKNYFKIVPNRYITLIVCLAGVLLSSWFASWTFNYSIIMRGVVSGALSTYGYEFIKNMREEVRVIKNGRDSKESDK